MKFMILKWSNACVMLFHILSGEVDISLVSVITMSHQTGIKGVSFCLRFVKFLLRFRVILLVRDT